MPRPQVRPRPSGSQTRPCAQSRVPARQVGAPAPASLECPHTSCVPALSKLLVCLRPQRLTGEDDTVTFLSQGR